MAEECHVRPHALLKKEQRGVAFSPGADKRMRGITAANLQGKGSD